MKIVLAVDGSDQSFDAARVLGILNSAEQLLVVHAANPPWLAYPTLGSGLHKDLAMTVEEAMKEEGERLLDRVVSILPPHHGPTSKRLEWGNPAEVVLNVAEEVQADLIVIGARGLGQIREHRFGSVSHRVMTHAACPTLVVKSSLRNLQHVLMPVESPEDGKVVCDFLAKKPFRDLPQVTIMHVIPFAGPVWPAGALIPESFRKEMMAHAEKMTEEAAVRLRELGYQAEGLAVMGAPSLALAEEASTRKPGLIVMRSHSRSGVSRFLLGSVSHSVAHHTSCSLLVVK